METWRWADVWRRRLARHRLLEPAARGRMLEVVGQVCGIHAQMAPSAELSLALRVEGVTRQDIRAALWQDRTLVKTYGLRGTLHVFPSDELALWLAALRAKAAPRAPTRGEREKLLTPRRRDQVMRAIDDALAERGVLTRDELEVDVERRVGVWATEPALEAFGGRWSRWLLGLHRAAHDGMIVFGPNRGNRVTYVRTQDWLGTLPTVDGQMALREVCLRFLDAYGPATHVEFARWFLTAPRAARELMQSLELEEVDVEGWRAWLPRRVGSAKLFADETSSSIEPLGTDAREKRPVVHLLPHFDCYVVGGFPRGRLIPESAPSELRKGTAAPFSVLLVDGIVAGVWERRPHGKQLDIRVHAFDGLSDAQQREVERQAARIGEIQELRAVVTFGHVVPRAHL